MNNSLKVESFTNSGIRNAAYVADNNGNHDGIINTRKEFEAIFDFYKKSKPNDSKANERMEDPTITADMNRLQEGYAIFEYNEFQAKQTADIKKHLKNPPKIKMPKNAEEFFKMMNSHI